MALGVLTPVQDADDDDAEISTLVEHDMAGGGQGEQAFGKIVPPAAEQRAGRQLRQSCFERGKILARLRRAPAPGRVVGDALDIGLGLVREFEAQGLFEALAQRCEGACAIDRPAGLDVVEALADLLAEPREL